MLVRLKDTLKIVQTRAGTRFSGIGILVCDAPERIPLFPIRLLEQRLPGIELADFLAEISTSASEYHDGFHVISSDWRLTRIAQYFSPPIVESARIDRSKRFGGRYLAALFGSALPDVRAAGIASPDFGIAIFEHGAEALYERTA
jgi:hypothetical protein